MILFTLLFFMEESRCCRPRPRRYKCCVAFVVTVSHILVIHLYIETKIKC